MRPIGRITKKIERQAFNRSLARQHPFPRLRRMSHAMKKSTSQVNSYGGKGSNCSHGHPSAYRKDVTALMTSQTKRNILLIDDSAADADLVRHSISTGLSAPNLMVFDDGVEALKMLHANPSTLPDLILLDLHMPRISGLQVLAEIKADPVLKSIPVVVLSSSVEDREICSAYGLHANCFITKPMDVDGYNEALRVIEEFWFDKAKLPSH